MSTVDTQEFRKLLEDYRKRAVNAIEHLQRANPGSLEDEANESHADNHLAETATVTHDRELDYTLEENEEELLASVDAALDRIDEGTFGLCARCANPIAAERLRAIPYATLCIDCKRKDERG